MKKSLNFYLVLIIILITLIGCSSPVKNMQDNESVILEGKDPIKLATSANYFPYSFIENNENKGFAIDVWNEIGKRIGRDIEFFPYETAESVYAALDSKRVQATTSHIAITPAIKDKYNFTIQYGYNLIKMAVHSDNPAKSIEDLHGKKVCIEPGGKLSEFFNNYNDKLPENEKLELVFTEGSIWEELELGRIDSFPITVLSFNARLNKGEARNIKLIGDAVITEENVFPVGKDMDQNLLEDINNAIREMLNEGKITEISEKWYNTDLTKKMY